MDRRSTLAALAALAVAAMPAARAQPRPKLPRIGILMYGSEANFRTRGQAFVAAMRGLGYEEGRTVSYDWRAANGQDDLLRNLAAELTRGQHDVVLSSNTVCTRALRAASSVTPIVFGASEDPVLEGFAKSMDRPGTNATGVSSGVLDLLGRQVELLMAAAPRLTRVTALLNPQEPTYGRYKARLQATVRAGTKLIVVDAATPRELEGAFPSRARDDADGLIVMNDALFYTERRTIAELSLRAKRIAIFPARGYVEAGGLMSYGPNPEANFARAAHIVDRVLKGARPGDIAIEPPARVELAFNRETARALAVTIPQELAAQAVIVGK